MSQFDTVIERKGTYSVKYNEKVIKSFANNEKALPFWVADMDFATPQVILDAIKKELDSSILGYPYIQHVAQSFISFAQKKHDISFDPSLVVVAPGMLSSIAILIELYSNKGDSIILPFPSYHPFVDIINTLERKVLPWPLIYNDETHTFTLDFPLLKELTKDNNSPILLFCSPHNPTGIVFSKEELEEIAKIVKESSMMVISDEIHADLAFNGEKHIPFHQIASEYNIPCITCMAPSKTFNIAGEHFSIAICSDKKIYINLVKRLKSLHVAPDVLATVASKAAYEKGYEWLISLIDYLEENIKVIEDLLKEYGSHISIVKPEASFIAFL
ncbi:MAG: aminotransferase class I/II-fold pyridoxal phosphate-dependent enzyme, partial [Spirochaetia bacterium]|nr:aminotransferase class I/II-fold pyridoxal phosphate-dependent enzyme [Spirochaetia bacterium]